MTNVEHMKWWGWGVPGISFRHDDKPAFAPFVQEAIGLDLTTPTIAPPKFEQLTVPPSRASDDLIAEVARNVGESHVTTADLARVTHTYGKSLRDLVRVRTGALTRVVDLVVYPADERQVQNLVKLAGRRNAVVIPFGGGSNIAGSLEPLPDEERPVISLDLGRLASVVDVDSESGLARVQAGIRGPELEKQLNQRGWTVGHFPDSFTHSTLGGWIATRSSGMQSDKYGDIADITRGVRLVRPDGVVAIPAMPSTSTGPSIREMILGSEGRLGVITEATIHVHRIPQRREIQAYLFRSFEDGVAAMRELTLSSAPPTVTRVSDERETAFSFATRKAGSRAAGMMSSALMTWLKWRGWRTDQLALSFVGHEGSAKEVRRRRRLTTSVVRRHNGIAIGPGPGALYDQKKFDTPYIRDFLLDHGAAADVSETATPWAQVASLYQRTVAAAESAYRVRDRKGWIMCHLSHSYHSGACLYFTFAFVTGPDPLGEYAEVKNAIQQAFIEAGGTLSHHHGVGLEHAKWLPEDISVAGARLLGAVFSAADPDGIFNPGKILPPLHTDAKK